MLSTLAARNWLSRTLFLALPRCLRTSNYDLKDPQRPLPDFTPSICSRLFLLLLRSVLCWHFRGDKKQMPRHWSPGEPRMLVFRFGKVQRYKTFCVDQCQVPCIGACSCFLACSKQCREPITPSGDDQRHVRPSAMLACSQPRKPDSRGAVGTGQTSRSYMAGRGAQSDNT